MRRFLKGLGVFAFWIMIWEAISLIVGQELLVPSPMLTVRTFIRLAATSKFWLATMLTLLRIAAGFTVGTALGGLLAFTTFYSKAADTIISPVIRLVRAVPVASFIILALVWIKTEALPSFISAAMAAPMVWQNVSGALKNDVDPRLLEMAKVYRLGKVRTFAKIVIPSIAPAFVSGAVNALGFAWKSGVAAEVICQPVFSIGRQLQTAKLTLETAEVFAWTAVVCIFSTLLEKLFKSAAGKFRAFSRPSARKKA